jgi:osmotically-inducible protein OsmY
MLRFLFVLLIVIGVAAWFLGYLPGGDRPGTAVGTQIDGTGDEVRQRGAELSQRASEGLDRAVRTAEDATLTAKIKSKMALDDLVQAREIDVDTLADTVTLTGVVGSEAERERALRIARETEGVRTVVDRLAVIGS